MNEEKVETIIPRTRIEITQQSMNALSLTARTAAMVSPDKRTQAEWISFFELKILESVTDGKTEASVDFWFDKFSVAIGPFLKSHFERHGFKFNVYQQDNSQTAKIWIEW